MSQSQRGSPTNAPILVQSPNSEASVRVFPDEWMKPIRVSEFGSIAKKRDIPLEYRILRTLTENDAMVTRMFRNPSLPKCDRYKDILPFADNRVVLSDGSYINASYMPNGNGVSRPAIIACQGPMASTIADQWDMVWKEGVRVIVTIGKLMEGSTEKCAQYWPSKESGPMEVAGRGTGRFEIELINESPMNGDNTFMQRTLRVTLTGIADEAVSREVTHYHFTAWPDHRGVPPSVLIELASVVLSASNSPVVVHCSAGVGRTGSVLAVVNCVQSIEAQLATVSSPTRESLEAVHLSVLAIVLELRKHRAYSVERTWQYESVYAAIAELAGNYTGGVQFLPRQ